MMVYVDNMAAPFGRMKMCHMIADSTEELYTMADAIGVKRKWIQKAGTAEEHFDICAAKKKLALHHGARQVGMKDMARMIQQKRAMALGGV